MFEGEFNQRLTPSGRIFQFTPVNDTVRYTLTIEDTLLGFTRDAVNPNLGTSMWIEDSDNHCAFSQSVDQ